MRAKLQVTQTQVLHPPPPWNDYEVLIRDLITMVAARQREILLATTYSLRAGKG
jgi:hypothetical protein